MRKALGERYQQDLQALENSQGWQGVFGSKFGAFAEGQRGDDTGVGDIGAAIAFHGEVLAGDAGRSGAEDVRAFRVGDGREYRERDRVLKVYRQAMRSALTSTLESLAAEAITYAIYATGLGFLRLAQYDYAGADAAFTSAAIWGTGGAASAVAGRAVAPSQNSAGALAPGSHGASAGTSAGRVLHVSVRKAVPASQAVPM